MKSPTKGDDPAELGHSGGRLDVRAAKPWNDASHSIMARRLASAKAVDLPTGRERDNGIARGAA
jgi:hypothetical protein